MARQIVLDTETTGFRPEEGHRIIEIGAIEMIDRRFTKKYHHFYLNPERDIDDGAFKVHGLSLDFLKDKPVFADIAAEFLAFIQGAELIIHNAPFDLNFLDHELRWLNQKHPDIKTICSVVDTLVLARQRHVGQKNSLDALCKRYEINNTHRQLHGALLDAHLLAEVYLRMTGGQNTLFDLAPSLLTTNVETTEINVTETICSNTLSILYANGEEQETHQKYLEKMKEKGECLWSDQ